MKKLRPLPDLSKLSAAEKDRLILRLYARMRAEEARLNIPDSARWSVEQMPFWAGKANKTPAMPGSDSE